MSGVLLGVPKETYLRVSPFRLIGNSNRIMELGTRVPGNESTMGAIVQCMGQCALLPVHSQLLDNAN